MRKAKQAALNRLADRLLRRPPQGAHQASDMVDVTVHVELALDRFGDPRTGP